jgi:hypothetical protein
MVDLMATKKITITLPEDVLAYVRRFTKEMGMPISTWIAEMVEHEIRIREGLAAMREWDAEDGPTTEQERAAARAELAAAFERARAKNSKKPGAAA